MSSTSSNFSNESDAIEMREMEVNPPENENESASNSPQNAAASNVPTKTTVLRLPPNDEQIMTARRPIRLILASFFDQIRMRLTTGKGMLIFIFISFIII